MIRIGIITVSDRAHGGEYEDLSGPQAVAFLDGCMASQWQPISRIVPDEADAIKKALIDLCDAEGCSLVLTTGGTGPAVRDVTPDATAAVCDRLLPGFGEQMRAASLRKVPTAILSRQVAGTRGKALIINLPGKPSAIRECLEAVFPAVPDCIALLGGARIETKRIAAPIFHA
jgi:molybdopterin adenylyltransferase